MAFYIRTCQECGHEQETKDPKTYTDKSEPWRDLKCKRCKSMALDYGKWRGEGLDQDWAGTDQDWA